MHDILLRSFRLMLSFTLAAHAESPDPSTQAATAVERLTRYHQHDPVPSARKLRVLYFLPSDREPATLYRERLTRVLDETASFYDQELRAYGFHARRLEFDRDGDGLVRCLLVRGKETWTAYNSKEPFAGEKVRTECLPVLAAEKIDPKRETIAVFTAIMEWQGDNRRFRQRSPYQGGGNARSGFCWQIDAPILDPQHLPAKAPIIDDGEYGMVSIGKWNSLFVGGVIHELGHAFGLPHNAQTLEQLRTNGHSLMGAGNRTFQDNIRGEGAGSFLTFVDALRLVSHPLFSGSEKGLWAEAASGSAFQDLQMRAISEGASLLIQGRVQSNIPCYGVAAYVDGAGGGDYDAIATTTTPEEKGQFELICPHLPPGKRAEVRLTALYVNGMVSTQGGFEFRVTPEGVIEMEDLRQQLVLAPIRDALRSGQTKEAIRLIQTLPDKEPAKVFATPMLIPLDQRAETSSAKEISLCDLKPISARVGWRKPAFDHSPMDLTIRVGGKFERRGIYAHAPSSYEWKLDGSWKKLQATCALRDDYDGSVVFIVKANGEEKWRSEIVRQNMSARCDVDIMGASSLELQVEDAGDNPHRDHGFWIAPMLSR